MKAPHVVYSLAAATSPETICYVGLTRAIGLDELGLIESVRRRFSGHRGDAGASNKPMSLWVRGLTSAPALGVLGLVDGRTPGLALERFWIRALRRSGHPLRNVRPEQRRAACAPAPSAGAQGLFHFIEKTGLSMRGAASQLSISHVFLRDILRGELRPGDVTAAKIEIWTRGRIAAALWHADEEAAIAAQRPHRAAG